MSELIVPIVPEGGNTKTPSVKQISPSIKWCFTLNNYTEEEYSSIVLGFESSAKKYIIGDETGDSGTPHLQGYVEFKSKLRPLSLKLSNRIHWEKARGNSDENYRYCSKQNVKICYGWPKPIKVITELRHFQKEVIKLIETEPDDRSIHWYYDYKGNSGKSALVKLLCYKYGAIVCAGKGADMKYQIAKYVEKNGEGPKIVIFDIPRAVLDYISYQGIEEIKNGCFASSKYESEMVIMNSPHILCFANELPDTGKLSKDRWRIHDLNPEIDNPE